MVVVGQMSQSSIPLALVVSVSKKSGHSLELSCSAYLDDISIGSLIVKHPEDQIAYEGPHFHDLDENLLKAFRNKRPARVHDQQRQQRVSDMALF